MTDTTGAIHKAIENFKAIRKTAKLMDQYTQDQEEAINSAFVDIRSWTDEAIATLQAVLDEVPWQKGGHCKIPQSCFRVRCQLGKKCVGDEEAAKLLHKITQKEVSDGISKL